MSETGVYSREKLFDFVKHDALLKLYNSPLLKEMSEEIAQTYHYFYGYDIKEAQYVAPLLIVNEEKAYSIFQEVAYDVTQSFGFKYFTNADLLNKESGSVLIHSIKLDHEGAVDKIKQLDKLNDTMIMLNFYNLEGASITTQKELQQFLKKEHDNIFFGVESSIPIDKYHELQMVKLSNENPSIKRKI